MISTEMQLSDVNRARRTGDLASGGVSRGEACDPVRGRDPRGVDRDPDEVRELVARLPGTPRWRSRSSTPRRSSRSPRGQIVAVAGRRRRPIRTVLAGGGHVLLEDPRHLGNLGAVVRVAAAAGAAAVMTTGRRTRGADALRGSAGLHFALPVHRIREIRTGERELIALDPRRSAHARRAARGRRARLRDRARRAERRAPDSG